MGSNDAFLWTLLIAAIAMALIAVWTAWSIDTQWQRDYDDVVAQLEEARQRRTALRLRDMNTDN